MPRGMTAEGTVGLFERSDGRVSFFVIIPNAIYGGKMPPEEGVYVSSEVTNISEMNSDDPMFAGIVLENNPGGKTQTLHVFANSVEGANIIQDLVCRVGIKPVCSLETAPPELLKVLSRKRRMLIKNSQIKTS